MAKNSHEVCISTFRVTCYVATISVIIFWVHKCFIMDEDLCLVDYHPIYSDDVKAPVLSLCVLDPFLDDKLRSINPRFKSSYYKMFLRGDGDDEELLNVDYENVTWDLSNYIAGYEVLVKNGTTMGYETSDYNPFQKEVNVIYNGFLWSYKYFGKCFEHSVRRENLKDVLAITTKYNFTNALKEHLISLHYPNHFLASLRRIKWIMTPDEARDHPQRWFNLREMEVMKRRNKHDHPCVNFMEDNNLDKEVHLWHEMKESFCNVPYLNFNMNAPNCSTKEEMRKSAFIFNEDFEDRFQPCEIMSNFRYEIDKFRFPGHATITLTLPKNARVIRQSKSLDTNALIGYIGGYVGLLLGKFFPFYASFNFSCQNPFSV